VKNAFNASLLNLVLNNYRLVKWTNSEVRRAMEHEARLLFSLTMTAVQTDYFASRELSDNILGIYVGLCGHV
jgi:hypothetical protein